VPPALQPVQATILQLALQAQDIFPRTQVVLGASYQNNRDLDIPEVKFRGHLCPILFNIAKFPIVVPLEPIAALANIYLLS
jgi:hypothetical protein